MNRRLLLLAALLVALVAVDAWVRQARLDARDDAAVLRSLVPAAWQVEPDRVRQLQLVIPGASARFVYERRGDTWRFPAYLDAYAHADRVERLLEVVLGGTGTLASTDGDDHDELGLAEHRALQVHLFGADGGSLAEIWIGRGVPGPGAQESYARRAGVDTVLHLHTNPVLLLGAARPPMLDPHLYPRDVRLGAIVEARVQFAGQPYGLTRVLAPLVDTAAGPLPPIDERERYRWLLTRGGRADTCINASVYEYLAYPGQVRFERLVDPGTAAGLDGGDSLELVDEDGKRVTLRIAGDDGSGMRLVHNLATGLVAAVRSDRVQWLTPPAAVLLDSLAQPSPFQQTRR